MLDAAMNKLENNLAQRLENPKRSWPIKELRSLVTDVMIQLGAETNTEKLVKQYAEFVIKETGVDSPLKQSIDNIFKRYKTKSLTSHKANRVLQSIRKCKDLAFFRLEHVSELREAIDILLGMLGGRIQRATISLFEDAKNECSLIAQRAAGKPIDPCWFAVKLTEYQSGNPSSESLEAHMLLKNRLSQRHYLPELEIFSKWLRGVLTSSTTKKRKKRGRKPASKAKQTTDEQTLINWERAKECGTRKQEFADDLGMPIGELEKLLRRARKREKSR